MPTAEIKCMPTWLPRKAGLGPPRSRAATPWAIAQWLPGILCQAINEIDGIPSGHADEAKVAGVEINFVTKDVQAINAVPIHIVVHPPEIDGDFAQRRQRRAQIRQFVFDRLWHLLEAENDHLIIPAWEIEVVPVETSGYGSNGRGEIQYQWGSA